MHRGTVPEEGFNGRANNSKAMLFRRAREARLPAPRPMKKRFRKKLRKLAEGITFGPARRTHKTSEAKMCCIHGSPKTLLNSFVSANPF
jgi:hypothetical protein